MKTVPNTATVRRMRTISPVVRITRTLLVSALVGATTVSTPVLADDTEVFFGQVDPDVNINPNVLFVMDTSGSMNDPDEGEVGSRLERMKQALGTIVDNSANINIGLMRFNGFYSGGSVLFPITPIDEEVCESGACGDISLVRKIDNDQDDSEENLNSNKVTLNGRILSMGNDTSNNAPPQMVGYRFDELDIPQGAKVTSAVIDFVAERDANTDTRLVFQIERSDDAEQFEDNDKNLSERSMYNSTVNWTPTAWKEKELYTSNDLSSLVQQVVNRPNWCGGNAVGFRVSGALGNTGSHSAISHDNETASSAVLKVTYDPSSIPVNGGCKIVPFAAAVKSGSDDAEQYKKNTWTTDSRLEIPNSNGYKLRTGVRFRDVEIPKGAVIEEAYITFQVAEYREGNTTIKIQAENSNNAKTFESKKNNIKNRNTTSKSVTWSNPPALAVGAAMKTPDLKKVIQQVVDRVGWSSGNAMAFIFNQKNGGSFRSFKSYDYGNGAPSLNVKYRAKAGSVIFQPTTLTAREKLKEVVNGMKATGGTPIVDTYLEATNYLLGKNVDHGKTRGARISDYNDQRHPYHRVSTPDSYTGGTLNRDYRCTDGNLDSYYCYSENISGSPKYISPLESSCQTSHIVFLSDGEATSNVSAGKVKSMLGIDGCAVNYGDEACGAELAEWLNTTDHNSSVRGTQNISTYTIGFGSDLPFMKSLAKKGGGQYFQASSASDLTTVFQSIIGNVNSVDTSFVAPGATVNQFNRLTHRNDIYFALFRPEKTPSWKGNLKRYSVGTTDDGEIRVMDSNKMVAVDEETGFFDKDAHSWWGSRNPSDKDGNEVGKGGAASVLDLNGEDGHGRHVYTYIGDNDSISTSVDLTATAQALSEDNDKIKSAMLGFDTTDLDDDEIDAHREDLLKWSRGVDVLDANSNDDREEARYSIGDPMHARPVLLNYADGGTGKTTIFVGTNQGYLHAIDRDEGREIFSYVPQELLPNLNKYYENQVESTHPYGLDGVLSVWAKDTNGNVQIDTGEKAYLYTGMRRGGRNYYAFDVSKRKNPRLKWVIEGGKGDFKELGQSWSKMVPTRIHSGDTQQDVLVFSAGYDTNQDPEKNDQGVNAKKQAPDSIGRGIFVVAAESGNLIWKVTADDPGFEKMNYSFPGNVSVIDLDFDGFADQLYAADTGGQLWRFDMPQAGSDDGIKGGVIADLSGEDSAGERRFYYEPDVALIEEGGKRFLSISLGSGWRAHPLNEAVEDRFYMIRQDAVFGQPDGYGKPRSEDSTVYVPITESDLDDVSTTSASGNDVHADSSKYGWMLKMEGKGEKVLARSVTFDNKVIFTSYKPDEEVENCTPALGAGNAYALNILTGKAAVDLDGDGKVTDDDSSVKLAHGGIPPEPTVLITDNGPTVLVGPEQPLDNVAFHNLTQRTYWVDQGKEQ